MEVFLEVQLVVLEMYRQPVATQQEVFQDHSVEVFLGMILVVLVVLLPLPTAISFTVPILREVELFLSQIFTLLMVLGLTPPLVVLSRTLHPPIPVRGPSGRV